MTRKKILWLCSWYPSRTDPFNGDFIQRHAQAAALFNDIHVIHVTGDASGKITGKTEEISKNGALTEHIIYYRRSQTLAGRIISHYRWLMYSREAIRKYIRENGKPHLVHVHVPMKMGILGIWTKRRFGIPYLLTEHWGIYNDVEVLNYQGRSDTFKTFTRSIIDKAVTLISVSKYLAEGINRLVTKKEYQVVPNTVNEQLFFFKKQTHSEPFRFIHVSNMAGLKNAEGILRAFKILLQSEKNAELIIVGDTNPSIRQYASQLGLGSEIGFRGEISYSQVAMEMQSAHCLVLFSNIENSPCVIGEAFCCGLTVIATQVGGIPELVDETNGILVAPQNDAMLSTTMAYMKNNYHQYDREKIAAAARDKFSYAVIGKRLAELYTDVTHDR